MFSPSFEWNAVGRRACASARAAAWDCNPKGRANRSRICSVGESYESRRTSSGSPSHSRSRLRSSGGHRLRAPGHTLTQKRQGVGPCSAGLQAGISGFPCMESLRRLSRLRDGLRQQGTRRNEQPIIDVVGREKATRVRQRCVLAFVAQGAATRFSLRALGLFAGCPTLLP